MSKKKKPNAKRRAQIANATELAAQERWSEAEAIWRDFLSAEPDNPAAIFNLGYCIQKRANNPADRFEAAENFEKVISSQLSDMEMKANAMNQMGLMARLVGHEEKALTAFSFALAMFPGHRAARINAADAHRCLGNFDLANSEYQAIIDQDPENAEARMCKGMLALLLGDFKRGWEEYRWRFKAKTFTTKPFNSDKPQWNGEDLGGKTILILEEQGFGDSFMFLRYAHMLKEMGAKTAFRCQLSLLKIAGGVFGLDAAYEIAAGLEYDYWLPLLDCPHFLWENGIPKAHCIRPMPDWQRWALPNANLLRKRIGLVWAGSPQHGKDKARSIEPELLQPLIDAHPECDFYSLQAGPRAHEAARLARIVDLAPQIDSWTTTAQMLMCLDLLVSVDTACVHLAGCVNTPVYMLCPHSPDWRWQMAREDSPWYKKLRLFRQANPDTWDDVIERISKELE